MGLINKHYFKNYGYLNRNKFYIKLILFMVFFIGVGYAAINTKLTVNGTAKMYKNTWNVHFENIVKAPNSTDLGGVAEITDDTEVEFTVDLLQPGDFYSFKVDVVNEGTIDAMLSDVLQMGLNESQEAYIDYTVMYADGEELEQKDALPVGEKDTLLVTVKYRDDMTIEDIPTEDEDVSLSLGVVYSQDNGTSNNRRPTGLLLYDAVIAQNYENGVRVLDNHASTYVKAETGIDFNTRSSETNGQGVYIRSGTERDKYPIFYYRGEITNNNVLFADFCWKMVRTTETGGIKLIYNGVQKEVFETQNIQSNEYTNVRNDGTYSYTFNSTTKQWSSTNKEDDSTSTISLSVSTPGYYSLNYTVSSETFDKAYFYLDDVEIAVHSGEKSGSISLGEINSSNVIKVKYVKDSSLYSGSDNVSFALGLKTGDISMSCDNSGTDSHVGLSAFNSTNTANAHSGYMYGSPNSTTYEAEHLSTKTSTSSTIKTYIDEWYRENMIDYTNYLEDTIWCNDRSIGTYEGTTGTGIGTRKTFYGAVDRLDNDFPTPRLDCINQNDRFTVEETMEGRVNGNGALTYPVALITADESILAGPGPGVFSYSSYLVSGQSWWTLSPYEFNGGGSFVYQVTIDDGSLSPPHVGAEIGVRPSVSLKEGTYIEESGDGSASNPFVIK